MMKASLILFITILSSNALQYKRSISLSQMETAQITKNSKNEVVNTIKIVSTTIGIEQLIVYQNPKNGVYQQNLNPIEIDLGSDLSKQIEYSFETIDFTLNGVSNPPIGFTGIMTANEFLLKLMSKTLLDNNYLVESASVSDSKIKLKILDIKNVTNLEKEGLVYEQGKYTYNTNQNENMKNNMLLL